MYLFLLRGCSLNFRLYMSAGIAWPIFKHRRRDSAPFLGAIKDSEVKNKVGVVFRFLLSPHFIRSLVCCKRKEGEKVRGWCAFALSLFESTHWSSSFPPLARISDILFKNAFRIPPILSYYCCTYQLKEYRISPFAYSIITSIYRIWYIPFLIVLSIANW